MVSVILPVYNAETHLKAAIESILNQTYSDFELLVLNDGSIDRSVPIIESFSDKRICLYNSASNIGLVKQLNKGLQLAKGKYIARMDADDIAYPERFQKQVDFLEANTEVGACGTWAMRFTGASDNPTTSTSWETKVEHDDIMRYALKRCPLIHPTAMFRNADIKNNGLEYLAEYSKAEDYKFWFDFSKHTKLANIPEILLKYRDHENNISKSPQQALVAAKIRTDEFLYYFNSRFLSEDHKALNDFFCMKVLDTTQCLLLDKIFVGALNTANEDEREFASSLIRSYYESYFQKVGSIKKLQIKLLQNKSAGLLKAKTKLKVYLKFATNKFSY